MNFNSDTKRDSFRADHLKSPTTLSTACKLLVPFEVIQSTVAQSERLETIDECKKTLMSFSLLSVIVIF